MKNDYNITVVVLTYNPVWEKLRATLKSIVEQQDVHLQVVITDDGSKNNHFDKVELFFKEIGFDDFKLISNKNNEGTVINLYRGKSKFRIRNISRIPLFFQFYRHAKKRLFIFGTSCRNY